MYFKFSSYFTSILQENLRFDIEKRSQNSRLYRICVPAADRVVFSASLSLVSEMPTPPQECDTRDLLEDATKGGYGLGYVETRLTDLKTRRGRPSDMQKRRGRLANYHMGRSPSRPEVTTGVSNRPADVMEVSSRLVDVEWASRMPADAPGRLATCRCGGSV